MATYKKGYKKESSEQLILKVIVGIILSVVALVLVAFVYDSITDVGEYEDHSILEAYETLLEQKDADLNLIQDYIIYFYSDECVNCANIKYDVLKIVNKLEKNGTKVFFANTADMADDDEYKAEFLEAINKSSLPTPTLVVVSNGEFYQSYTGTEDVLDVLNQIKVGEFAEFAD